MKKLIGSIAFTAVIFLNLSCEEDFDPYGEHKERYILNCVIRGDTTFQTATLTKNYSVNNFDPYSNTEDQAIKDAIIRIWNGDKVTILKDSTIDPPEGSLYKRPYTIFYTNNFQPEPNSSVEIEAILPDGKRLTSTANVPGVLNMSKAQSSDRIPPTSENFVKVKWTSAQADPTFIVRLAIYYFKHENGKKIRGIYTVPMKYLQYDDKYLPSYPRPQSELIYAVDMETVNKSMELISYGDSDKSKYEILSCIAEVLSLNDELSFYYNATARSEDIYSVKLDETDFSSIKNGYGLFGVYMRAYYVLKFTHAYIRSFGYEPSLTEVQ